MKTLTEAGLVKNDLDYLIMPMIDIDTYESKIDNSRAVVIAFYVFEQEPAKDLERFIEKGNIEILDAETSPAPTEDGYYVVFIEMDRNRDLPELLYEMVQQINNLTNVEQWQFKTLHDDELYDLTEENLVEHVNLDPAAVPPSPEDAEEEMSDDAEEAAEEETAGEEPAEEEEEPVVTAESAIPLLRNGMMGSVRAEGDVIYLVSPGSTMRYKVKQVSESEPSIPVIGFEIGNPLIGESVRLSRVLGAAYSVEAIDGGLLVGTNGGYIILETID